MTLLADLIPDMNDNARGVWCLALFALACGALRISFEFRDALARRSMVVMTLAVFAGLELQVLGLADAGVGSVLADLTALVGFVSLLLSIWAERVVRRRPRRSDDIPVAFVTRPEIQREIDDLAAWHGCRHAAVWVREHGWICVRFTVSLRGWLLCNHLRAADELVRVHKRFGHVCTEVQWEAAVYTWPVRRIIGKGWQTGLMAIFGDEIDRAQAKHMRGDGPAPPVTWNGEAQG